MKRIGTIRSGERSPDTCPFAHRLAAAFAALAAGFAFWAVVERPVTSGGLRRPLLDAVRPAVERAFAFVGVPRVFRLEPAALPQTQPLPKALY